MARARKNNKGASIFSSIKKTFNKTLAKAKVKVNQVKHGAKNIKAKIADRIKPKEYPREFKAKIEHLDDLSKKATKAPEEAKIIYDKVYNKERSGLDKKIQEHFKGRVKAEEAAVAHSAHRELEEQAKSRRHFKELGLSNPAKLHSWNHGNYPTGEAYKRATEGFRSLPEFNPKFAELLRSSNQQQEIPKIPGRMNNEQLLQAAQNVAPEMPRENRPVLTGDINSRKKAGRVYKRNRGRGFWDAIGKLAVHQHDPVP